MAKVSQASVHYRDATSTTRRCSTCAMFSRTDGTPHCSLVVDPIHPAYICDEFEPKRNTVGLSAQTARLERTPAPYGKPGGPGLYNVKGQKHSDYFEQIVKAMMRNGKSKGEASAMAWGILRRWAKGGGHVHPEVRAAAIRALAEEKSKVHSHANIGESIIELYGTPAGAAKIPRDVTGKFTSGQGGGKQQKIHALRQRLAKVNAEIKTTRIAILADIKAAQAAKKAVKKTTTGKSPKANAKSAKKASTPTTKGKTRTSTHSRPSASRLIADRRKLSGLIAQRQGIKAQLAKLGGK